MIKSIEETTEAYYVGWIPGNPWHRRKWRKLGVKGKMKFRWTRSFKKLGLGVFEYCEVDDQKTMDRLVASGLPNPDSFSLIPRGTVLVLEHIGPNLWEELKGKWSNR